ncbi:FixH family protein [Biformimicrobium ophioploci]|uniref:FixH family protein n=1 Tax=Biformimicrobium ophioploci TaxID=3036711 RepID=A0ABQ6LXK2_9GAMM|nr:FixH family protein [Microbulbifer sp. NKW57]GMG86805.1 FixH family protein [Microbulbifer sp. NKW57]
MKDNGSAPRGRNESGNPWYREPWAWFVLTPLIVVVIACSIFFSIAVRHSDDVVSDTYYRDGRMYNFRAEQDSKAREMGLSGFVHVDNAASEVSLELQTTVRDNGGTNLPEKLLLTFSHPTDADLDQHISLEKVGHQRYRGQLSAPLEYRWYLRVMPELDPAKHSQSPWRLKGEINLLLGSKAPVTP